MWAAEGGNKTTVKLLLSLDGIDTIVKDDVGKNLLSFAAASGNETIVRDLLAVMRGDPNFIANIVGEALPSAVESDGILKLLLSYENVDVNKEDARGNIAICIAVEKGLEGAVEQLILKGADPNARNREGQSPLYIAVYNQHEVLARRFLGIDGVDIDARCDDDRSPLYWAACNEDWEIVKLLSSMGADPNVIDEEGETPLFWAVEQGPDAAIEQLIEAGFDPDARNFGGISPLAAAAIRGREGIVEVLLQHGVEVDSQDKFMTTPLHHAAENGHVAIVKRLIAKGADVNSKEHPGSAPVFGAIDGECLDIVKILIDKGADLKCKDSNGRTALDYAKEIYELVRSLREYNPENRSESRVEELNNIVKLPEPLC